jgi:hypothetical protein
MSYENAPATRLVATHCACCSRPLVDAASVERGVGPECARKYGYDDAQGEPDWDAVQKALDLYAGGDAPCFPERDAHKAANVLVHYVAAVPSDASCPAVAAIDALGFKTLARTLALRLGAIVVDAIQVDGQRDMLVVKAPYSEAFNVAMRRVPGARWNAGRKARMVPAIQRMQLWAAIKTAFGPGTLVVGSRVAVVR